ncbi:MAG: hypothetical protein KDC45_14925, partial [Bacteroidetes bacterium]|nr:hypothetical protein [Bacteroidota bacterium]
MKTSTRAFGLTLLTFVLANPCAFSQDPVSIVYPRQHMLLSTVDSTIVLGRILLKGASLQINGQLIRASPDGAFLDFISIPPDSVRTDSIFAQHCVVTRLDTTVSFVRTVRVPIERPPLDTIALEVDPLYLCFPADSVWLNSGEVLPLRVRASPGRSVSVRIMNGDGTVIDSQLALLETESGITDDFGDAFMGISKPSSRPKIPGLYETSYTLRAGINYRNARCLATVSNHTTGLTRGVSGTLNTYGPPRTVEITAELANVRNRPGRAYTYFLPQGVRCVANGRIGQQIRLNLSKANEGWISRDQIKELSSGHPEPSSLIPVVRVEKTEKG